MVRSFHYVGIKVSAVSVVSVHLLPISHIDAKSIWKIVVWKRGGTAKLADRHSSFNEKRSQKTVRPK